MKPDYEKLERNARTRQRILTGMVSTTSFAPSAIVPALAAVKYSRMYSGNTPDSSPIFSRISRIFRAPCASAAGTAVRRIPSVMASSCIFRHRSMQEKQGSMLATIRPASATVLPRSITGRVGAFRKVGTWMLTLWPRSVPLVTTL